MVIAGFTVLLVLCAVCWLISGRIVSPERKMIEPWHGEWLQRPERHGIAIQPCVAGDVPCLIVTPDSRSGPAARGRMIRQQVEVELPAFGEVIAHVVLLHGRNGRKEDMLPVAERFCAVGFLCVLPDLPAHGDSRSQLVHYGAGKEEDGFAGTVLDKVEAEWGLQRCPRAVWGMSMGGAFAVQSASEDHRWFGIIVVSSFDAMESVLRSKLSGIPAIDSGLISAINYGVTVRKGPNPDRVRPVDWAAKVKSPVLLLHGDCDTFIPIESGARLLDGFASEDKMFVPVSGGGHGDVLITPAPTYALMVDWLLRRADLTL